MTRNPNQSTAEELERAEYLAGLSDALGFHDRAAYWKERAKSLRSDYAREGW